MPNFSDIDAATWGEVQAGLRAQLGAATCLEQASEILVRGLYSVFGGATALVRVYTVVPYRDCEPAVQRFVDRSIATMARTSASEPEWGPATPVLALLATHGVKAAWCDRKWSKGHLGIPLLSETFVQGIPMVARLLKELGVQLQWLDDAADVNARRLLGGFNGVFFVGDAASARDNNGRLIIPAQDFVAEQNIRTVFGMGGFFPGNVLVSIIFFCTESLQREQVDRFKSLVSMFKGEVSKLVLARKIFASM